MAEQTSKDEIIGYHKGSINTLIAERNELLRIVQVTEGLINAHVQELEKAGVKMQTSQNSLENSQNSDKAFTGTKRP